MIKMSDVALVALTAAVVVAIGFTIDYYGRKLDEADEKNKLKRKETNN